MRRRRELPPWQRPGEACRLVLTATTAPISGPVAVVVGTVLTAVNQGAVLLDGKGRRLDAADRRELRHPVLRVELQRAERGALSTNCTVHPAQPPGPLGAA